MKKILLVDDEADFCHFVKANLMLMGSYEVIVASKGKKGIGQALKDKPDVILLDIMMPGIDGLETLKRLKANQKTMSIPVIILTAKDDEETKDEAVGSYCEDYITKPVEMNVLKSKIDKVLSRSLKMSSHKVCYHLLKYWIEELKGGGTITYAELYHRLKPRIPELDHNLLDKSIEFLVKSQLCKITNKPSINHLGLEVMPLGRDFYQGLKKHQAKPDERIIEPLLDDTASMQ